MASELLEAAREAVRLALRHGASEAAAAASRARQVELTWRDGKVETASEATTRGLGVDLYVDGRYGSVSTSDLRPEAIERLVRDGVDLTRTLAPDPFRRLPDPALYAGRADLDLQLFDPHQESIDAAERREAAAAMEAAARAVPGAARILSVSASVGDTGAERAFVASNGFEGERRGTDHGMSVSVSVSDPDGRRPEDWDAATARHHADRPAPADVGRGAAERALSRVGSEKGASAVTPVLVDARAAGRLVGSLLGAATGVALQQKRSFLEGRIGTQVGSEWLDLRDDPHVVRGLGSRLWDGEGIASHPFPVFEKGVLRTCYVDTYYGRKLGMAPTTGRISNLAWRLGPDGRDALLARMGDGLLVTGFLGGNANGTTGDFSFGVQGFRVVAGKLAGPVGEMNASGNLRDLWTRLVAVGNDPYRWSSMRTPSLLFSGLQIAGR
ncbi:MAG TPA: TldD/PmbA family protein [Anaeromyxobacteraceae bacterium]|nr:TldD/PmbA family protein [Anaeromyxobacteraceae bacterium]